MAKSIFPGMGKAHYLDQIFSEDNLSPVIFVDSSGIRYYFMTFLCVFFIASPIFTPKKKHFYVKELAHPSRPLPKFN